MDHRIPKKGEVYKHFKGNLYEIITLARDSETLEEKIVYKSLDTDDTYVRPLSMFLSLVDRKKYPDANQEYRFERIRTSAQMQDPKHAQHNMIMEYLDLPTSDDKILYLQRMKDHITEEFIGIVALSMELSDLQGSLSEKYRTILKQLEMVAKHEQHRFR